MWAPEVRGAHGRQHFSRPSTPRRVGDALRRPSGLGADKRGIDPVRFSSLGCRFSADFAHDVALPGSSGGKRGFLMYPQAETADLRLDCLDPDAFKYRIRAKELTAA